MLPPQPQLSLPTPKNGKRHGVSRPFARRRSVIGERPGKVMYSTHSRISFTLPDPTLPQMYGSAPIISHRSKNSCVPKWLFSVTLPQCVLTISGGFRAAQCRFASGTRRQNSPPASAARAGSGL
jgi:hypothetical protein